jgi:hypothetical protein
LADEKKPLVLPKEPYLPFTREQNPAPLSTEGQQGVRVARDIVDAILRTLQQVLPSNYVAEIPGPYYVLQFQAAAEQLAQLQLQLEDVGLESDVDFARPDYLWQMIGTLVFPDTTQTPHGIPEVDGDLTYREFLRRMIVLLLQGATEVTQQEGLSLLTTAVVEVLSKVDYSDRAISAWGFGDQHEFEINLLARTTFTDPTTGALIEGELGTGFPADPATLLRNNQRILRALKPAKALYEYRHLFKEVFGELFSEQPFFQIDPWYYEDFRLFCCGMKELTGTEGVSLSGRTLFSDVTRDFRSVPAGATLEILDGPNSKPTSGGLDTSTLGRYRVVGVLRMPFGVESALRPYTTSPSGLSGAVAIANEGVLTDVAQDFSDAVEGETLTILAGPNAGQYRLETLLGLNGGPLGQVPPGSSVTSVRVAPSILQLRSRMPQQVSGQTYRVSLERLGVRTPYQVLLENASAQFYL